MGVLLTVAAQAYDFSSVSPSGQRLYYRITSAATAEVVRPGTGSAQQGWSGFTMPTGRVEVPPTVTDSGRVYSVTAVGEYAFYLCEGIAQVVLPSSVAVVGNGAFNGCTGIHRVDLPVGVRTVGIGAFRECTGLDTVVLPATIDTLKGSAFVGCTGLTDFFVAAATPPYAAATAFSGVPLEGCTLHVPQGCDSAYRHSEPWSGFGTITSTAIAYSVGVLSNHSWRGTVSGAGVYGRGMRATLTATAAQGCFFACWNDGDTLNPRYVTVNSDTLFTAYFFAVRQLTDTLTVVRHDTVVQHDTVRYAIYHIDTVTLRDTLRTHDTLYVTDTIRPTYFRLTVLTADERMGLAAGNGLLPAGAMVEIAAIPIEGYRFAGWDDGPADNPRTVTVSGNMRYTARFETTAGLPTATADWHVEADGHALRVSCPAGSRVRVYDGQGRQLADRVATAAPMLCRVAGSGVYLVQVDDGAARRVVVTGRK